ncbi:MAG: adenosine kinase, partial [Dinoroseobacter sp.]|nr:adenosine kinase [Dinoroseobacter sp.]
MNKPFQVVGIGNAIVDVLAQTDDSFLDHMGIEKGIMQLVDRPRAEMLYAAMSDRVQAPGGSVANTLAGLGELGLRCAFIGRVKDDALGRFYADGMEAEGTAFPNPPQPAVEAPTSRSMIFVTPDGERSMNTYLGAGADLGPEDVSEAVFSEVGLLFLEGYLFDKVPGKAAFEAAARYARASGGHAGITLSDPFCVDRHREDFQLLVADELNFVIGNQHEYEALYETDDLEQALAQAASV